MADPNTAAEKTKATKTGWSEAMVNVLLTNMILHGAHDGAKYGTKAKRLQMVVDDLKKMHEFAGCELNPQKLQTKMKALKAEYKVRFGPCANTSIPGGEVAKRFKMMFDIIEAEEEAARDRNAARDKVAKEQATMSAYSIALSAGEIGMFGGNGNDLPSASGGGASACAALDLAEHDREADPEGHEATELTTKGPSKKKGKYEEPDGLGSMFVQLHENAAARARASQEAADAAEERALAREARRAQASQAQVTNMIAGFTSAITTSITDAISASRN
mmetsp:Transcript_6449/g.13306  ORF Transcript_6449/g.13306 Transcript_6449/m.13306 type:complete len:276 (+) Transcript_6449:212-1039(+)